MLPRVHELGSLIGQRYELLARLARGGMGTVYRARHVISRREVALKLVNPGEVNDPAAGTRFQREAQASSAIDHPGIVEVLDAGVADDGSFFLVMELLEGHGLGERLAFEGTTLDDGLTLVERALDPLAAAHEKGFVHRDLKPDNIFVLDAEEGAPEVVKLLDFGIAKHVWSDSATLTGTAIGTPHYMPPEQIMSAKSVSPAADVWSMGVILYELLTGELPFAAPVPQGVFVRVCTQTPTHPGELADVGEALPALVMRCLEKNPEDRPRDATELREALREAAEADGPFDHVALVMKRYVDRDRTVGSSRPPPMLTTPSTAPRVGWQTVEGDGWSFELPPSWSPRNTLVPNVGSTWQAPGEGPARPRMVLKVEPFDGDTETYVTLGIERLVEVSRFIRSSDAELAGRPSLEVESVFETIEPPFRTIRRAIVVDGMGFMMSCEAPVLGFRDWLGTFRAILGSLHVP